jgi:hypothetical protein
LKTNRIRIVLVFFVAIHHRLRMRKLYSTLYKSVVRATNDLVKDIKSTTGDQTLRYWAWEDRVDEDKMPRVPLMGVNGFTLDENNGLWIVRFGVTISSIDDANLLEEADMIDAIHDVFGEKKTFPLRDPDTGDIVNDLVSVKFEVFPMGQTQVRNYRSVGIEIRRTGT